MNRNVDKLLDIELKSGYVRYMVRQWLLTNYRIRVPEPTLLAVLRLVKQGKTRMIYKQFALSCSNSNPSDGLACLKRHGIVNLTSSDDDKRVTVVEITQKGLKMAKKLEEFLESRCTL